jgi:sugar phosphate isomerase/epimerase
MDPKELQTRAAWVEFAHVLDEIGERLRPHGMHTGYHNHTHEFRPLEGEAPWEILAANSNPEVVMQLDLGNAAHGGGEPLSLLRRHVDRALTLHLKEYSSTDPEPLVGGGEIPWADVFSIAEEAGKTQWYIVEQEVYPYPPLESAERSLKFLREMGK